MTASFTTLPRQLLHVGCGKKNRHNLPPYFHHPDWQEIRYDIDPAVAPDLIGSITDLHQVGDASISALWSSHNLEHLHSFEVPDALEEFHRVLRPDGFAVVTVPDLRAVAKHIVEDQLETPLYKAPAGPINALDVIFGHQQSIERGNGFMAHRTGFSARTLGQALLDAGFAEVRVHEGRHWDLWAIATMPATGTRIYQDLASLLQ